MTITTSYGVAYGHQIGKIYMKYYPCNHEIELRTYYVMTDTSSYEVRYTTPDKCPECKNSTKPKYNSTIGTRYF